MKKEEVVKSILSHFKKHWLKWCVFALCVFLSASGYTCENKYFKFNKTPVKLPGVKSSLPAGVQ